jgi:hypothetical protein
MKRDIHTFFESQDVSAKYEIVDGVYIGHLTVDKWNKGIRNLVINLLLDFCENVNEVIYTPVNNEKHRKFLDSVGFLKNSGKACIQGAEKDLYEFRDLRGMSWDSK